MVPKPILNIVMLIILVVSFSGCLPPEMEEQPRITDGYKPVYGSAHVQDISFLSPQEVRNPGKIYRYGKFLLVNELHRGIHIFNNESPADPQPVGFLNLLGNTDMAIKDNVLYADHAGDLVAVQLNSLTDFTVIKKLELQTWDLGMPPPKGSYFQCVNPSEGYVVAWKKVEQQNLSCYAY